MSALAGIIAYLFCGALLVAWIGRESSKLRWCGRPTLFERALCAISWPMIVFQVLLRWR